MNNTKPSIKMYTTTWCGDCIRSKKLLDDLNISYEEINIEESEEAAQKVIELNDGNRSVPTIIFPDGSHLTEPDNDTLRKRVKIIFELSS